MNSIDFGVKRSKFKVTVRAHMVTLGGIFSPAARMQGHISMKLITVTHWLVHATVIAFSRSNVKFTETFSENALPRWRHANWQFASEVHL